MRIAFWASSFQADTQALACHLASSGRASVLVAMPGPERYLAQPINSWLPFRGELVDRDAKGAEQHIKSWNADVLVVDNHLPRSRLAPKLFVLWHGYGWRVDDLTQMKRELRALLGDVTVPNDDFCWQAFGPIDQRYRVNHSGFAPANVRALGSAFSDLVRPDSELCRALDPAALQAGYPFSLAQPAVLLGFTWHHGAPFAHWGDDAQLFSQLLQQLASQQSNVILRLHDKKRYEKPYLRALDGLCGKHDNMSLSFRDECPDSTLDILVSKALVSNYSSLLNGYYYSGKPTIHVDPSSGSGQTHTRWLKLGRVWKSKRKDSADTWKVSPQDIGGLRATSFEELTEQLALALKDGNCCRTLTQAYLARHITEPNGSTCSRMERFLAAWVASGKKPDP